MNMSFESPEGKLSKSYFFIFFPNVFLELQAYLSRTNKHDYSFVSHCIPGAEDLVLQFAGP